MSPTTTTFQTIGNLPMSMMFNAILFRFYKCENYFTILLHIPKPFNRESYVHNNWGPC